MTIRIEGNVAPGFERVADAFAQSFVGRPGMGAALAIRVDGDYVARLWAGTADTRTGRPWQQDTPSVIFSCTKGVMSLLVARLVEQGLIDYDAPMARYWPEFAANGKAAITVREREILTLVGLGRSNAEIAAELSITPATAKTYTSRLLTKLDARDRVQLVITAYESGLVGHR